MRARIFDFEQRVLVGLKLNMNDVLILNYLENFFSSGHAYQKKFEGENYYWITYKKILGDLPILNMKTRQLQNVLNKLIDKDILKKKNDGKKKMYFCINFNVLYDMTIF